MKMIEWCLCHEYGFLMSDVSSVATKKGPSSVKSPNSDVDPGPPCSHPREELFHSLAVSLVIISD
jgi:hypothetical protein